jgi:hypothetical protein
MMRRSALVSVTIAGVALSLAMIYGLTVTLPAILPHAPLAQAGRSRPPRPRSVSWRRWRCSSRRVAPHE